MLHDKRVTYSEIKMWMLEAYYDFCRDRGVVKGLPHLQILGYVDYEFEVTFERPIEQLMFRVSELILSGGWYLEQERNIKNMILAILAENNLDDLLKDVPREEADLFKHDLAILKLL